MLPDLTPLRENVEYRRLYVGFLLSNIGTHLAVVAIGLQVYDLTGSTASVGLVGFFALVPLVVLGLYGGSLADHHDRRRIAMAAQILAWLTSLACALQAWLGNTQVWVLYLLVACWNGAFGLLSPARSAIYPRILPLRQLPAANFLHVLSMNLAMTVGPLLAGFLIDWSGFTSAYAVDAVITTAALWGLWRLRALPPVPQDDSSVARAGARSVLDGLAYLAKRPNLRMTFVVDLVAMVLAQPRVLLPAAGAVILGGGARTVGYLYAAVSVGGIAAMMLSGPLSQVRRQGVAVMVSVAAWGVGVAGLGVALVMSGGPLTQPQALYVALVAMAFAGSADAVSAVFRTTILQAATPDRYRGRLQGVFVVVVNGGPRVGEVVGGVVAEAIGEGMMAVVGGVACAAVVAVLAIRHRQFLAYDAERPSP